MPIGILNLLSLFQWLVLLALKSPRAERLIKCTLLYHGHNGISLIAVCWQHMGKNYSLGADCLLIVAFSWHKGTILGCNTVKKGVHRLSLASYENQIVVI